eukprot:366130-Chlamydomonas_euryale.AAC.9
MLTPLHPPTQPHTLTGEACSLKSCQRAHSIVFTCSPCTPLPPDTTWHSSLQTPRPSRAAVSLTTTTVSGPSPHGYAAVH